MMRIVGQIVISFVASLGVLFWYHVKTHYSPGHQVNDALECLMSVGNDNDGKLTFDLTGVVAERGGEYRYLWLIGKEEGLRGSVQAIQCKITDTEIEVRHPTQGVIKVTR